MVWNIRPSDLYFFDLPVLVLLPCLKLKKKLPQIQAAQRPFGRIGPNYRLGRMHGKQTQNLRWQNTKNILQRKRRICKKLLPRKIPISKISYLSFVTKNCISFYFEQIKEIISEIYKNNQNRQMNVVLDTRSNYDWVKKIDNHLAVLDKR